MIAPEHVHIEKMNVSLLEDELNTYEARPGSDNSMNEPH